MLFWIFKKYNPKLERILFELSKFCKIAVLKQDLECMLEDHLFLNWIILKENCAATGNHISRIGALRDDIAWWDIKLFFDVLPLKQKHASCCFMANLKISFGRLSWWSVWAKLRAGFKWSHTIARQTKIWNYEIPQCKLTFSEMVSYILPTDMLLSMGTANRTKCSLLHISQYGPRQSDMLKNKIFTKFTTVSKWVSGAQNNKIHRVSLQSLSLCTACNMIAFIWLLDKNSRQLNAIRLLLLDFSNNTPFLGKAYCTWKVAFWNLPVPFWPACMHVCQNCSSPVTGVRVGTLVSGTYFVHKLDPRYLAVCLNLPSSIKLGACQFLNGKNMSRAVVRVDFTGETVVIASFQNFQIAANQMS